MPDLPRVCLVGESNPYGADPRFALYPRPENAAGGRLARHLGLERPEYLRAFLRRNLLTGPKWSAPAARAAAATLLVDLPPADKLVLLGARVSAAFGVSFKEHVWSSLRARERSLLILPHPSGRNLVWNDPVMALKACVLVDGFRRGTVDARPMRPSLDAEEATPCG